MVVWPKHKLVYVGIPRTASSSIHNMLVRMGGKLVSGMHWWKIPEGAEDYAVAVSVRFPCERCLSLAWKHWTDTLMSMPPSYEIVRSRFRDFMEETILPHKEAPARHHRVKEAYHTQSWFCEATGASIVLNFERLPRCLMELPGIESVPFLAHQHASVARPSFESCMTKKEEALVWEYCSEDFERFGYRRLKLC